MARYVAFGTLLASLGLGTILPASSRAEEQRRRSRELSMLEMPSLEAPAGPWAFYFTRAIYGGGGRRRGWSSWGTDFPKADRQFISILERVTNLSVYEAENAIRLDDPNLRRYPFLYALEVGSMMLSDVEVQGLRDYLLAGGFLVIDDFWGTWQWQNFEFNIQRVLPGRPIVDVPLDHPIFHAVYEIEEIIQVPEVRRGIYGGPTHEQDGYVPYVKAIFDDQERLMVIINWNTDLGDAWEWADNPYYPLKYSTYAFQMGVNFIIYAMSH